jgi:hypothetical protein
VDIINEVTESQRQINPILRAAAFSHHWDQRKAVFWPYLQLHHSEPWYVRLEAFMHQAVEANSERLNSRYEKPSE